MRQWIILLSIRGRTHFSRTLLAMDLDGRVFWEYLNYVLALLGLGLVWLLRRRAGLRSQVRYRAVMNTERA